MKRKKEDLRKHYGMQLEGHSEDHSLKEESEWLGYIIEFERQFENAAESSVLERIGNPAIRPLSDISDLEVESTLVRKTGISKIRLKRSPYSGWDVIRAKIAGWNER